MINYRAFSATRIESPSAEELPLATKLLIQRQFEGCSTILQRRSRDRRLESIENIWGPDVLMDKSMI